MEKGSETVFPSEEAEGMPGSLLASGQSRFEGRVMARGSFSSRELSGGSVEVGGATGRGKGRLFRVLPPISAERAVQSSPAHPYQTTKEDR